MLNASTPVRAHLRSGATPVPSVATYHGCSRLPRKGAGRTLDGSAVPQARGETARRAHANFRSRRRKHPAVDRRAGAGLAGGRG